MVKFVVKLKNCQIGNWCGSRYGPCDYDSGDKKTKRQKRQKGKTAKRQKDKNTKRQKKDKNTHKKTKKKTKQTTTKTINGLL